MKIQALKKILAQMYCLTYTDYLYHCRWLMTGRQIFFCWKCMWAFK